MKISLKKYESVIGDILFAILGGILVLGGLGSNNPVWIFYTGGAFAAVLLIYIFRKNRRVIFPPHFIFYLTFLLSSLTSILWSLNKQMSYEVFILLFSGALFWLLAYNADIHADIHKEEKIVNLEEWINSLIIYLGLLFGILYLYAKFTHDYLTTHSFSLYLQSEVNHNHVGDLEALVLTFIAANIILKKSKNIILMYFAGIFSAVIIILSGSRSAILGFIAGLIFILNAKGILDRKKMILAALLVVGVIFVLISGGKTTLFSREYYFQAIGGFINHPFGVGMGNFSEISLDPKNHILGFSKFTKFVHNIILEAVSGAGLLAIPFIIWFIKVHRDAFKVKSTEKMIFAAIFICLSVNFFFDYIYFAPTLFWLWFTCLGLSQAWVRRK